MPKTPRSPGGSRDRVYRFVRDRLLAGRPPTVREVQAAAGFRAVESARAHLEALVAEGRLAKAAGARGYRLPGPAGSGRPPVAVPLLGRVQAGALTTAVEEAEGWVAVETRLPPEELFALRVRGDSMRGAGILEGDVVVVRRQSTARDGEIVVALVGEEATVKRLRLRGGRVELHPENPAFSPLVPAPDEEVEILGVAVELRRDLTATAPAERGGRPGAAPPRAGESPPRARSTRSTTSSSPSPGAGAGPAPQGPVGEEPGRGRRPRPPRNPGVRPAGREGEPLLPPGPGPASRRARP